MHSLPLFVKLAGRPVILLGDGASAGAKARLLKRAGARIVGEQEEAQLAIVAIEDEATALDAIGRLKARGILVNAVDRPDHCDFTLPAILDRDPVIVAIGTGGASAGLAKALRQRLELLLPDSLGKLATALFGARAKIRAKWPEATDRRRAIDAALAQGNKLDPFSAVGPSDFDNWLGGTGEAEMGGTHHVKLRSNNPDDLTLRDARLLSAADIVYAPREVASAILNRARADAEQFVTDNLPDVLPPGVVIILHAPDKEASR